MRSPRTTRRAFTLIESVIALVILGTAVPPMLLAVRQLQRNRAGPVMTSKARWLVTEKLEDIIADRHSPTRGYTHLAPVNYPAESPVAAFPGFTRTVAFNETAADLVTAGAGYMKVTVTVGWTDAGGVARSMAMSTVITDYPG